MAKRIFGVILVLLISILTLVSCDIVTDLLHTHEYGEWTISKNASCEEAGTEERYCDCGEKETKVIAPKGHTVGDWKIDREPTCTIAGEKYKECTTCHKTIEASMISALGHSESEWIVDSDATCTITGEKHKECTTCHKTIEISAISAFGHNESEWIVDSDATCKDFGSKHKECTVCKIVIFTESVPLVDHTYGEWTMYNEIATDCETNIYYRICSVCSGIEWRNGKYEDHDWNTVTIEPTCTAQGYDTKTCTVCGKIEICNYTDITDHKYETSYSYDNSFHWFKCQDCDAITGKAEHAPDNSAICSVCDYPVGPTEGLIYEVSNDGTYATLVAYEGTATKIRIADEYMGVPVKIIYEKTFQNNNFITSVIISNSIITIGNSAFV